MKLVEFLKKEYNYNPNIKDDIKGYIEQWERWYEGDVKDFHNYFIYNGREKVPQKRYTMNMPKEISEDWADVLWSEKCKISMKNNKSQQEFNDLANDLGLDEVISQAIEKSGALGTCAVVTNVYDLLSNEDTMTIDVSKAKTRTDIVDVDLIFPLSWNNKTITECAFGSVEYNDGNKYIVLSVHKLNDKGNYVIYNHLFKETNSNLTEIKNDDETISEFDTLSNKKWFAIFKPNLTNNLFKNNPFGIPHYANSIDKVKAVDIAFDGLPNEVKDGRKRTFVRADMLNYDDGTQKMVFDPNDTSIYVLPKGATKDDLIQSESDDLRTDKLIGTLNTCLNILGNSVGFGENHYHFDGTNLSTATAVISSNSKMFRRKKRLEVGYESAIFDLVQAICYASSTFGNYNIDTDGMVILFDDSIVEDKQSESTRALEEVSAGVLSKVEYRMKIFGETEEIARQKIDEIRADNPTMSDLLGTDNE